MNSRFAGVSRAARSLIGSTSAEALAAADAGAIDLKADDGKPSGDDAASEPVDDGDEAKPKKEAPIEPPAAGDEPDGDGPDGEAAETPASIRADERARVATVFASEHATGRERQAADMLGTSMSADEITGLLAKAPKGAAAADPMLAALAADKNPDLGAGNADRPTAKSADDIWAKARPAKKS